MSQMKEQDKNSEEKVSKVEISNLPDKEFKVIIILYSRSLTSWPVDKEFKVIIIKMLKELRGRMEKHSKKFHKELEKYKK